jgi:hypothetical protein
VLTQVVARAGTAQDAPVQETVPGDFWGGIRHWRSPNMSAATGTPKLIGIKQFSEGLLRPWQGWAWIAL